MLPWWTCDSKVLKEPFKDQSFGGGDNAGIKAGRTPASKGCILQALKPQKALHLGIQWPEVEQQLTFKVELEQLELEENQRTF
jgi:hypothetical protein